MERDRKNYRICFCHYSGKDQCTDKIFSFDFHFLLLTSLSLTSLDRTGYKQDYVQSMYTWHEYNSLLYIDEGSKRALQLEKH